MRYDEAKQKCPEIILVPQEPDLYGRAYNKYKRHLRLRAPILVTIVSNNERFYNTLKICDYFKFQKMRGRLNEKIYDFQK